MTWKTHIIGGAIAGIAVCAASESTYAESALIMSASVLGSVLPDIDQPNSKICRSDSFVGLISFITSKFTKHRGFTHTIIGAALFGAIFYALAIVEVAMLQGGTQESLISFIAAYLVFILLHATGSPLKPLAGWLALAAYAAGPMIADMMVENSLTLGIDRRAALLVACGVTAGALSHVIFDAFNKGGVPILFPLSGKNYRIMEIRTNTVGEFWFIMIQICIFGVMLAVWGMQFFI